MMTKQNLSKIADVALLSLLALAALFITLSAVLGPPSLWMLARVNIAMDCRRQPTIKAPRSTIKFARVRAYL